MLGLGLGAEQAPLRELMYRQAGGGDSDGGGDLQMVRVVAVHGAGRADELDVLVDPPG